MTILNEYGNMNMGHPARVSNEANKAWMAVLKPELDGMTLIDARIMLTITASYISNEIAEYMLLRQTKEYKQRKGA